MQYKRYTVKNIISKIPVGCDDWNHAAGGVPVHGLAVSVGQPDLPLAADHAAEGRMPSPGTQMY